MTERFDASHFATGAEAVEHIVSQLCNESVGFGGSKTLEELGLFERLSENNTVHWHWKQEPESARAMAAAADVYMTSANAIAETGEIFNVDGSGNRVASTLYGKKKLFVVIGTNKIEETFDKALWRARNIAAPLNARRLNKSTPCAKGEMKCHDCSSPDRICCGLVILWNRMFGIGKLEVVIIDESLGF